MLHSDSGKPDGEEIDEEKILRVVDRTGIEALVGVGTSAEKDGVREL